MTVKQNLNIIFHGLILNTKVIDLYKAYRVTVLPTLHKRFGLVLHEGMSSHRPIVAIDAVCPHEIVVNSKKGYVAPMEDHDALAEAVCKLLDNYDFSYRMGLEGRHLVEERYDWNTIVGQYYRIYEKLAR